MKGKPFLLMESTPSGTNWQGVSKPKKPGMHLLSSLQAVAHGSDSVQYFQWRQSRGGQEKFHGAVVSHLGTDTTRTFCDVSGVGKTLAALASIAGSDTRAEAAVVYDFQNGWALDMAQIPQNEEKRYQETCIEHYSAFLRRGIACDVIDGALSDFSGYKVVVLPMLYMFREGLAERLRAFVKAGGTLVATYLTGLVDETDLCALGGVPGSLTDLFGLTVEFTDTVVEGETQGIRFEPAAFPKGAAREDSPYAVCHYADKVILKGAAVQGTFTTGELAGSAAVTEAVNGAGHAWYVAGRTGSDFLDIFYGSLADSLKLTSALNEPVPGVYARERIAGDKRFLFLMNFRETEAQVVLGRSEYRDAVTGDRVNGAVSLGPFGVQVLETRE